MNRVYLHKDDLVTIMQFMDAFEESVVEITSDTSSGIGAITTARLTHVNLNGNTVNVEKIISDEKDW
jgi:hypothetical protein